MSNPGSCGGVFSLFPGASLPGVETPLPHAAPPLAHSPHRRAASSGGAAAAARKVLLGVSAGTCQLQVRRCERARALSSTVRRGAAMPALLREPSYVIIRRCRAGETRLYQNNEHVMVLAPLPKEVHVTPHNKHSTASFQHSKGHCAGLVDAQCAHALCLSCPLIQRELAGLHASRMCTLRRDCIRLERRSAELVVRGRIGGVASAGTPPGVCDPCKCSILRRNAVAIIGSASLASVSHGLPVQSCAKLHQRPFPVQVTNIRSA